MPFDASPPSTTDVISQTHNAVFDKIEQRLYVKGALQFFTAETGLGKTTGAQNAMVRLWHERWAGMPFLVMVPTRKDADLYWQAMETLEPGSSAVWTQAHDPSDATTGSFTPSCSFTKEQAKNYRCLIITHNAGKVAEDWVGRRDAVLIDEYPAPVSSGVVWPWQFVKANDEELSEPYRKAADWAVSQVADSGLKPSGIPAWVGDVLHSSPRTEAGKTIQELARHMQSGRAFQRSRTGKNWVWYSYDLPFEEKAIVFSATAHLEGWHLDPLSGGKVERDGIRVDYRNMTANFHPWPKSVSRYHKDILTDWTMREEFMAYISKLVGYADEKTFLVVPKDFESDIKKRIPNALITHYGCDVGSNQYRNCSKVWLISQFHQPKDVLFAKALGHGKKKATAAELSLGSNFNASLPKQLENDHHSTQIKQMAARGTCRYVDSKGVAKEMELNCLFYDVESFSNIIPEQFPGAKLVYPSGFSATTDLRKNKSVTAKIVEHLSQVDENIKIVSAKELLTVGINIKGSARKQKIINSEELFDGIGWNFVPSPASSGRGQQAKFIRKRV